ncbi:MAG: addiction module protein [Deltaproteobacteria bacterium]|nr:addiction module protein [Deltaproteobacteria bacterium]
MTTDDLLERLRAEAMKLPESQRRELVRSLQDTLDNDADDDDLHPAWHDEIARRVAALDNGTSTHRPLEEVMADIRARFGW